MKPDLANPVHRKALGIALEQNRVAGKEDVAMSEHAHAVALMNWVHLYAVRQWPGIALMFHIPNEAKRSFVTAARLKAEGMKPGIPDYFLPVARDQFHGMFLELKKIGEKPTLEQAKALGELQGMGYYSTCERGWIAAAGALVEYLS